MRAMTLHEPVDDITALDEGPLVLEERAPLTPADDEVVVDVSVCGVCRTDLHVVEGELELPTLPIVPGHQVVGTVAGVGAAVERFAPGDRVGVAWVNAFDQTCDYCITGRENLCDDPTFTGFHRDGGFAEQVRVPAAFAHPIPDALGDDAHVAPLLCAGIIGYRSLKRSGLRPGHPLALYGFGAAAHIAIQIARGWGCETYVVSRDRDALARAERMGAVWTGQPGDSPPRRVDHAVTFAPAGSVVPEAMRALDKGGTLAIAGIYLDRVPEMDYHKHLFDERQLVSVTANTRADARELLEIAGQIGIETDIATFPLEAANEALRRLKADRLDAQAGVLEVG